MAREPNAAAQDAPPVNEAELLEWLEELSTTSDLLHPFLA